MKFSAPSPTLGASEVHIWVAQVDAVSADATVLAPEELARARRYRRDDHRMQFVRGRAWLRRLLSRYLGLLPSELEFDYGPAGKPFIAGDRLAFNLAHSGSTVMLAVAGGGAVGVDLEAIRPEPLDLAAAALVLSPEELCYVRSSHEYGRALLRCWTRKEACAKASGRGLEESLTGLTLTAADGSPQSPPGTLLRDVEIGEKWLAALATAPGVDTIRTMPPFPPGRLGTGVDVNAPSRARFPVTLRRNPYRKETVDENT